LRVGFTVEGGFIVNDPVGQVHYTELAPARSDSPTAQEWETYRREAGRLFAEGNEGRFVLIKGDRVNDFFATEEEAEFAGYQQFLLSAFLVQQVREYEPVYFHRRAYCHPWYLPCRT
jgi:hypothetical protein